jgi:hypothetical protein
MSPKAQSTKGKSENWISSNFKTIAMQKYLLRDWRQHTEGEKIFSNHISNIVCMHNIWITGNSTIIKNILDHKETSHQRK